jgi:hypothetical protein
MTLPIPGAGQMAQTVTPNAKCEGCLNYESQRGQSGVCIIGLRPWLCGDDGANPSMGYAPIAAAGPNVPSDQAPSAQVGTPGPDGTPVPIKVVVLGEEHAQMVKSIAAELDKAQRADCIHCSIVTKSQGQTNITAPIVTESCDHPEITDFQVAKALVGKLTNRVQAQLTAKDIINFVSDVRGHGLVFKAIETKEDLGDLRKSLYGDEWLNQFKYTPLFDEAAKLCEEEITIAEEQLTRRIEQRKKYAAAPKVAAYADSDYEAMYDKQDKLRIKKQKLILKLARHSQKKATETTKGVG